MALSDSRAADAFLLRSMLAPPWSLRIEDGAPVTVVALLRGSAVIVSDTGNSADLAPGDIALVRGPDAYTVCDHPDTPPHVTIDADQNCHVTPGAPALTMTDLGVRTWGNAPDGPTAMLTGTYRFDSYLSRQLLDCLTPIAVVPRSTATEPMVALLAQQITLDGPGQSVLLDRLLDLVLIAALREWLSHNPSRAPIWISAYDDPIIGNALRLIHNRPEQPWTVERLARECNCSRATFARHFSDRVGVGPVGHLTEWRLSLAADLLSDPQRTVSSIAAAVGYSSPFALTAAFTRRHGVSPREFRRGPNVTRVQPN